MVEGAQLFRRELLRAVNLSEGVEDHRGVSSAPGFGVFLEAPEQDGGRQFRNEPPLRSRLLGDLAGEARHGETRRPKHGDGRGFGLCVVEGKIP